MRHSSIAIVLTLLLGGTLAVVLAVTGSLNEQLHRERVTTAQGVLHSVGVSLAHARDAGVPLDRLVGVDDLLSTRGVSESGVVRMKLFDPSDREIWAWGASAGESAEPLNVPVNGIGRLQAEFVPPGDAARSVRVALLLLAFAVALAIPVVELSRFSHRLREGFSSEYFQRQVERVRQHNLRVGWRLLGVGGSDDRQRFLRDQIFLLNEQYQRVMRLVRSLQRTEPDADRRNRMGALLDALSARFRFAGANSRIDRPVWPAADTARCFAALALLLANLSLGGSSGSAYASNAEHYSALAALLGWAAGLLAGSFADSIRWPLRLQAAIAAALLANLLMATSWGGVDVLAHFSSGVATSLAASAALNATRGQARPTVVAMLAAATVAGPALGLAVIAALIPFATVGWFYGVAAGLSLIAGAGLWYCLEDNLTGSTARRARAVGIRLAPLLAGAAWIAAVVIFIALNSTSREQALRLAIIQLPGLLLLLSGSARARLLPALGLLLAGVLKLCSLMIPEVAAAVPSGSIAWLGAACVAGALAAPLDYRGTSSSQLIRGFAVGVFSTLAIVALVSLAAPAASAYVIVGTMLLALIGALILCRPAADRGVESPLIAAGAER